MADSKRNYLYVKWRHNHPEEPVHLYSELDGERFEVRKVEIFSDGRRGFADGSEEFGGTRLGEMAVPPMSELESDPQVESKVISADEFQWHWLKRR